MKRAILVAGILLFLLIVTVSIILSVLLIKREYLITSSTKSPTTLVVSSQPNVSNSQKTTLIITTILVPSTSTAKIETTISISFLAPKITTMLLNKPETTVEASSTATEASKLFSSKETAETISATISTTSVKIDRIATVATTSKTLLFSSIEVIKTSPTTNLSGKTATVSLLTEAVGLTTTKQIIENTENHFSTITRTSSSATRILTENLNYSTWNYETKKTIASTTTLLSYSKNLPTSTIQEVITNSTSNELITPLNSILLESSIVPNTTIANKFQTTEYKNSSFPIDVKAINILTSGQPKINASGLLSTSLDNARGDMNTQEIHSNEFNVTPYTVRQATTISTSNELITSLSSILLESSLVPNSTIANKFQTTEYKNSSVLIDK